MIPYLTYEQATAILITESVSEGRIPRAEYSPELALQFRKLCENSVEDAPEAEYWGTNGAGDKWRVHLVRRRPA